MNEVHVFHSKLNLEQISSEISSRSCGTCFLHVGINLENADVRSVEELVYEVDATSAEEALRRVSDQVRGECKISHINIYQRLGSIPVLEPSVVVAIWPHNVDSFRAMQCLVSALKSNMQTWRKVKLGNDCFLSEFSKDNHTYNETAYEQKISPYLIQIKADTFEINRRIRSFIERKREQVNMANVQDFCHHDGVQANENSCARVNALLVRRKDSKSHLRIRRVLNTWGPQIRRIDDIYSQSQPPFLVRNNSINSKLEPCSVVKDKSPLIKPFCGHGGLQERLSNAEQHVNISGPVPVDVYTRLKQIEDRILYLEGISPEYFQYRGNIQQKDSLNTCGTAKKTYSVSQLSSKLHDLENILTNKM